MGPGTEVGPFASENAENEAVEKHVESLCGNDVAWLRGPGRCVQVLSGLRALGVRRLSRLLPFSLGEDATALRGRVRGGVDGEVAAGGGR